MSHPDVIITGTKRRKLIYYLEYRKQNLGIGHKVFRRACDNIEYALVKFLRMGAQNLRVTIHATDVKPFMFTTPFRAI